MMDVNDGTEPIRNLVSLSLNVISIGTSTVPRSISLLEKDLSNFHKEEPWCAAMMPLLYGFTFYEERSLLNFQVHSTSL